MLVESPTYPGALAEAFAMTGVRLFYCQPTFHNPTGTVLAAERRAQVLEVARAAGAFVLEDDFARYLSHESTAPRPLIADDRYGTVVHLTSVTKAAAPSLRIGALIARGPVLDRMKAIRRVDDFFVSRPLQEAALELLSAPSCERHVRKLGAELRERCAKAAAALAGECPEWTVARLPSGGLHLWVRLPAGSDANALARAATADLADLAEGIRRLRAV